MAILSLNAQRQIEEELLKQKLASKERIDQIKQDAIEKDKPFLTELIDRQVISEEALAKVIAKASGVPYVNLTNSQIDKSALQLIPRETAERYMAVPIGEMNGQLAIAMLDPTNVQAVDYISSKIGRPLTVYMASHSGIKSALDKYGTTNVAADVHKVFGKDGSGDDDGDHTVDRSTEVSKVKTIVQDSPISRALKAILDYSVQSRASDVHIEPREDDVKVRVRVDGMLKEIMTLPKSSEPALISRIKILSNLKIDEHRIPQDGQFQIESNGKEIDIRVAVAPVVWGEQVVLRLLVKDEDLTSIEDLGYFGRNATTIREGIHKPHGMIIASGPTGSGKSTTLYALINEIKNETINVVTLEDPVERKIENVNQIQVNSSIGLTFASGLRSILRQDPDVVMVGEIRDKETATLAIQAALTGHLVFSTLHTNSAAGVLPRLIDMGIEPFLIAATVNTIIAQRLVRRVCDEQETYNSSEAETAAIKKELAGILPQDSSQVEEWKKLYGVENLPLADQKAYTLYKGKETSQCINGYKGRMGIYEVFSVSDRIQELIGDNVSANEIEKQARNEGMITMAQDGYLKALNGYTSLEEVGRVASDF